MLIDIVLASRYYVIFDGANAPEDVEMCSSRMEAFQHAEVHTHHDSPFASRESVVVREAHPDGNWGEHSCARFVEGKMVFP